MKIEKPHLIIGLAIILLVVGAYYTTQPLSVFVSPAIQYASTGEKVTFELMHYNQYDQ